MKFRAPVLWLALLAMWLALNGTLALGDVILGAIVASAAVAALARLETGSSRFRRPLTAASLA